MTYTYAGAVDRQHFRHVLRDSQLGQHEVQVVARAHLEQAAWHYGVILFFLDE